MRTGAKPVEFDGEEQEETKGDEHECNTDLPFPSTEKPSAKAMPKAKRASGKKLKAGRSIELVIGVMES